MAAFGGTGQPYAMSGGEGRSWRAGDIVLKRADGGADELEWQAVLLTSVNPAVVRLAPPLRSADGRFIVEGWFATEFLVGQHERGRWAEIIRAGEAFHAAIADEPRPELLARRTDRWAVADRVAWGELPAEDFATVPHVPRLAAARQRLEAPGQLVHGDLTGNVLFADGLPPAIIDFSAYWRPAPFASAVVLADALVWEGAGAEVLDAGGHIERLGQYLIRALIFRLASHFPAPDGERYRHAVDLALELAG